MRISFLPIYRVKIFSRRLMNQMQIINPYTIAENFFLETTEKHSPLKKKLVRVTKHLFMNRDFQKATYIRSRLKNKYSRELSRENELAYERREINVYQ